MIISSVFGLYRVFPPTLSTSDNVYSVYLRYIFSKTAHPLHFKKLQQTPLTAFMYLFVYILKHIITS